MSTESAAPSPVPNPYKASLASALATARTAAATAASIVDPVVASMEGQAWVSQAAQEFISGVRAQDRTAARAGQDTVEEIRRAHDAQPDRVAPTDWQMHWRNLR